MAAPGKMTRHDMKQDGLFSAVDQASGYLSKNPVVARNGGIALAAVVVLVVGGYLVIQSRASSARDLLKEAESRFAGSIATDGARVGGGPVFASEPERDRAALEKFTQLVSRYGGRKEGRIGLYYQGVLLARLDRHKEAEESLSRFLESPSSPLLAGLAKAQLAQVRAAQGDLEGAAKAYSELAEQKEGGYPREWALLYLAQTLDQQNKHAEALAAVQKIKQEFPGSPVQGEAERFFGPAS